MMYLFRKAVYLFKSTVCTLVNIARKYIGINDIQENGLHNVYYMTMDQPGISQGNKVRDFSSEAAPPPLSGEATIRSKGGRIPSPVYSVVKKVGGRLLYPPGLYFVVLDQNRRPLSMGLNFLENLGDQYHYLDELVSFRSTQVWENAQRRVFWESMAGVL